MIVLALGLLMALVGLMAGLGLYGVARTSGQFRDVSLRDATAQQLTTRINYLMESNRSQVLQALQHNPNFEWAKRHDHPLDVHFKTIAANSGQLKAAWAAYLGALRSPDERALAQAWFDKSGAFGITGVEKAAAALPDGRWDDAETTLITVINPTYRAGAAASDELNGFIKRRSAQNDGDVAARIATVRALLVGALVVAWAVAIGVGALLVGRITEPLGEAVRIARRVADGDLGGRIEAGSHNELGVLIGALGDMNASLAKVVGTVRANSERIASGSAEIAGGNADLSKRTEDQAASLEETAAALEQLSSTVRSNAATAHQATELAGEASRVAIQGGAVVARVVETMGAIAASSKKISDIIGVIDGIAFQTNILALNAAVEAARAGEQGRGFAVVAAEVRGLAQRSAQAAKEIASLIHASVEKVESGSLQVGDAGRTMDEVVAQVRRVSVLIGTISAATDEQTSGIGEVGQAMTQLDRSTQQNAVLVEKSAASAQALRQQAGELVDAVAVFKLTV